MRRIQRPPKFFSCLQRTPILKLLLSIAYKNPFLICSLKKMKIMPWENRYRMDGVLISKVKEILIVTLVKMKSILV